MQRITDSDLDAVLGRYVRACERLEMVPHNGFTLHRGSKTYGNAYRLFTTEGNWPAPGTSNGYLGMTKREAHQSLMTMALTLEAYLHHTDQL